MHVRLISCVVLMHQFKLLVMVVFDLFGLIYSHFLSGKDNINISSCYYYHALGWQTHYSCCSDHCLFYVHFFFINDFMHIEKKKKKKFFFRTPFLLQEPQNFKLCPPPPPPDVSKLNKTLSCL